MGLILMPGWCKPPTAISMAQLRKADPPPPVRCSGCRPGSVCSTFIRLRAGRMEICRWPDWFRDRTAASTARPTRAEPMAMGRYSRSRPTVCSPAFTVLRAGLTAMVRVPDWCRERTAISTARPNTAGFTQDRGRYSGSRPPAHSPRCTRSVAAPMAPVRSPA